MRAVKSDFPIFAQPENEHLIYLDSAATTQKPAAVINAITHYYQTENANIHRGVHRLSERATEAWEKSKASIAVFLGADPEELIVTRNTTEAINGIAYGWGINHLRAGDVIITTLLEHHSNFVPWQQLAQRAGAKVVVCAVTTEGRLDLDDLKKKLQEAGDRTKLVAFSHLSNTLGSLSPVKAVVGLVRQYAPAALIALDSAQSAPHLPIDFHQLDVDFLAFSGHKLYGPMGVGGLLVRQRLLADGTVQPWLFGGGMIGEVFLTETTFNENISDRFTAGTPDVASLIGLAAAVEYLQKLGWPAIEAHERELIQYGLDRLTAVSELTLVGPTVFTDDIDRIGSIAFLYNGVHAHDVAQILDSEGIAVRSGHHCTMPLHERFSWPATVRASFSIYNTREDIDALVAGLQKVKKVFGK